MYIETGRSLLSPHQWSVNLVIQCILTRLSRYLVSRENEVLQEELLRLRLECRSLGNIKMKEDEKIPPLIPQDFGFKFKDNVCKFCVFLENTYLLCLKVFHWVIKNKDLFYTWLLDHKKYARRWVLQFLFLGVRLDAFWNFILPPGVLSFKVKKIIGKRLPQSFHPD